MIAKRYIALSLIPLGMLVLGFAALVAPDPFRGPLMVVRPFDPALTGDLNLLWQPFYLADAVGLILIVLAMLEVWIIGITWEYRRHRH